MRVSERAESMAPDAEETQSGGVIAVILRLAEGLTQGNTGKHIVMSVNSMIGLYIEKSACSLMKTITITIVC